jgi:hypothetical protein
MQGMGQQAAVRVIERNAGFVAGGFDAEYEHGISLKMRKKTGKSGSKRRKRAENGKNQQLVDWGVVSGASRHGYPSTFENSGRAGYNTRFPEPSP